MNEGKDIIPAITNSPNSNSFDEIERILIEKLRTSEDSDEREKLIGQLEKIIESKNSNTERKQKRTLELQRFQKIELIDKRNDFIKLLFNMGLSLGMIGTGVVLCLKGDPHLGAFLTGGGLTRVGLGGYVDKFLTNAGEKSLPAANENE